MTTLLVVPASAQKRASSAEVAAAVLWMMRSERNVWMGELFAAVFGCSPEDAVADADEEVAQAEARGLSLGKVGGLGGVLVG